MHLNELKCTQVARKDFSKEAVFRVITRVTGNIIIGNLVEWLNPMAPQQQSMTQQ